MSDDDDYSQDHSTYGFASQVIALCDALYRCDTPAKATKYVETTLANATISERERCVRAYFGVSLNRIRVSKYVSREKKKKPTSDLKKGGVGLLGAVVGGHGPKDTRICRMLAAADTFHDFKSMAYINRIELPSQITTKILTRERDLIETLSKFKRLTFDRDKIENPFFGVDILRSFDLGKAIFENSDSNNASESTDVETIYKKQTRQAAGKIGSRMKSIHVDVMTVMDTDSRKEVLKLCQVCQLLCAMRRCFSADAEFVVDASGHPLVTLVVSLKNIDNAFFRMYLTKPYHASLEGISLHLRAVCAQQGYEDIDWKAINCDATLFDSALNSSQFDLDATATNDIYDSDFEKYQVTLLGARITPSGRMFRVRIVDSSDNESTFDLTSRQATKYFSINNLAFGSSSANSKNAKTTEVIDRTLAMMDEDTRHAIKRAGDWGQVKNCKLRKRVFVTRDKLAAMYAHYENVDYIFLAYEQKCDIELPDGIPRLFLHSWTLCPRVA